MLLFLFKRFLLLSKLRYIPGYHATNNSVRQMLPLSVLCISTPEQRIALVQMSLLICFYHQCLLCSLCWHTSILTVFTTDDIETPRVPNSGHSLSNTSLNHLFLKLCTPTPGKNSNYNANS